MFPAPADGQPVVVALQHARADALHLEQLLQRGERPVRLAILHDGLGQVRADPVDAGGQRRRIGAIDIDRCGEPRQGQDRQEQSEQNAA